MTKERIQKLRELAHEYDKEHVAAYYMHELLDFIEKFIHPKHFTVIPPKREESVHIWDGDKSEFVSIEYF